MLRELSKKIPFFHPMLMFVVILLSCNAGFWLLNYFTDANRPFINLDYFLILPFFLVNHKVAKVVAAVVLFFVLTVDSVLWSRQFFPFLRLPDVIFLMQFIFLGPFIYKIYILLFGILFSAIFYMFLKTSKKISWMVFLVYLVVLKAVFELVPYFYTKKDVPMYANSGFLSSQLYYLYGLKDNLILKSLSWTPKLVVAKYHGATEDLFKHLHEQNLPHTLILIVNESWGKPVSLPVEQAVLQPVLANQVDQDIQVGELGFVGATVNAELRELCQLDSTNFNLRALKTGFEGCLAHKLKQQGYDTYAFHAANGVMYDRSSWYKLAGFDHTTFFENMPSPQRCYSFPGACDSGVFPLIIDKLANTDHKKFIYWMTLNSHYPYDSRDIHYTSFNCQPFGIDDDTESCRNLKLQNQFFVGLAEFVRNPALKGAEIIVVGDHQPPLLRDHQHPIFKQNTVSVLHIKIKG